MTKQIVIHSEVFGDCILHISRYLDGSILDLTVGNDVFLPSRMGKYGNRLGSVAIKKGSDKNAGRFLIDFRSTYYVNLHGKKTKCTGLAISEEQYNIVETAIADFKEEIAQARAMHLEDIKAGRKQISVTYHDGEYLSGWEVVGEEAELLEKMKVVKYVPGWGYRVPDELVIDGKLTYVDAKAYSDRINNTTASKQNAEKAKREAVFANARESGTKQVLTSYMVDCDDPKEECSFDTVTVYAMPDGSTSTSRIHNY